jgi:hypothetical protein
VLAGFCSVALAQSAIQTSPVFLGGYNPDACRFPPEARRAGISGCCEMDLEINADGLVTKIDGICSDPIFLEPTRRCLAVLGFAPATRSGRPVASPHHMQYEWRANAPSQGSLCRRLTS